MPVSMVAVPAPSTLSVSCISVSAVFRLIAAVRGILQGLEVKTGVQLNSTEKDRKIKGAEILVLMSGLNDIPQCTQQGVDFGVGADADPQACDRSLGRGRYVREAHETHEYFPLFE